MYWTLELASYLEDAPWPATKDELIDFAIRAGAPLEVVENLQALEDEGDTYESIEDLMGPGSMQSKGRNPELTVKWDEDSFKVTPKDHHPSLKCHQVMAENVIRHIERNG